MAARASGLLLHPTSLPGRHAVGDLGPEAWRFIDDLAEAGVSVWQMLPVTEPGAFESPYDCRSAFAGSWLLISPERLLEEGLLTAASGQEPMPRPEKVDYGRARREKERLLRSSWSRFRRRATAAQRERFESFCRSRRQRAWLDDWALFAALDAHLGGPWTTWPEGLRSRRGEAMRRAAVELAEELEFARYLQFLFDRQFVELGRRAEAAGVLICGDLPMYVAHHSADVWAHPELFDLDESGAPAGLAGVPPDAFSAAGQLWGAPVYRWGAHRAAGFSWWIERLRHQLHWVDMARLDHFRGFVAYWRVPAAAADARRGRWVRGPGEALFRALAESLGELPLIAEDLGRITPPVEQLRDRLDLPGMKVIQFAFDREDSDHLPEHHRERSVVYTGTHDNDTLRGWLDGLGRDELTRVGELLGTSESRSAAVLAEQLVRAALASVSELAILPLQDLLGLGSEARMNTPGTIYGNWSWRLASRLDRKRIAELRALLAQSGRLPASPRRGVAG